MKNYLQKTASTVKTCSKKVGVAVVGALATVSSAMADVPVVVGTQITAMQTDALAVIDLVWVPVAAVTGGFVLFKIFKRGAGKI